MAADDDVPARSPAQQVAAVLAHQNVAARLAPGGIVAGAGVRTAGGVAEFDRGGRWLMIATNNPGSFRFPLVYEESDDRERLSLAEGEALAESDSLGYLSTSSDLLKAVENYSRAIQERPEDHGGYWRRARYLFSPGRFDEAIADGTRATELAPESNHGWFWRARGLQLQCRCATTLLRQALCYQRLGHAAQARRCYDEALDRPVADAYDARFNFESLQQEAAELLGIE